MKKRYVYTALGALLFGLPAAKAQTDTAKAPKDSAINIIIDQGFTSEKYWRTTGSSFTLDGKQLTRMFTGNLLNTLQGRIPGLTVVSGSGEPGYDGPSLYVRGQSSWNYSGGTTSYSYGGIYPTILLDGFEVDADALSALSPYEIESITVLKDAATLAMYGLQGGSGVVSIRTKRGEAMDKNEITINGKYGLQSAIQLPKVMDAYDYVTLYNQALQNDGLPIKYPNPDLYKAANDPFHPNVDWYNAVLNNSSQIQDYNVAFRGGSKSATYFVLGDYENYTGLYKDATAINKQFGTNAKYNKFNLRANLNLQLTQNLSMSANLSGVIEDRSTPAGFTAPQLFNALMNTPAAAFPIKNPNGTWGNNSVYQFNPVEQLQQGGIYQMHTRTLQADVKAIEKLDAITQGLSFFGGISFNNQYAGQYITNFSVLSYQIQKNANDQPIYGADSSLTYSTIGTTSQSTTDNGLYNWNRNTIQAGFNYDRSFGKSTFTGVVLGRRMSYTHNGQQYPVHVQGLSANITYDYDQRYVVNLTGAYMGSADFAVGHQYGVFPAVGLGWVASNEKFLKNNPVINYLKIRASYGTAGDINENYRFLYNQQVSYAPGGWGGVEFGSNNTFYSGLSTGAFGNPNAKWETVATANIGFDIKILESLSATFDVFRQSRTGIYEVPSASIPSFTGYQLPSENTGATVNKGFEAVVTYDKEYSSDFGWHISGTVSYAKNKITKMSEVAQPYNYLYNKGYSIGQARGLVFNGFYQTSDFNADGSLSGSAPQSSYANVQPGDLKFKDINGDGIINQYDMVPMDYTNLPQFTFGLNLGFNYKGFDLDAFFQGVADRTVSLLSTAYNYTHPFENNNNITAFSSNSWTLETAQTATTPRLSTLANPENDQASDFWYRNGDFLKLRSLEVGYTLPQKGGLKKVGIRIFLNGTNLFTFNKINGLEPEDLSMGYPLTKVISLGFNVKL